jgi:hypothetical protein
MAAVALREIWETTGGALYEINKTNGLTLTGVTTANPVETSKFPGCSEITATAFLFGLTVDITMSFSFGFRRARVGAS